MALTLVTLKLSKRQRLVSVAKLCSRDLDHARLQPRKMFFCLSRFSVVLLSRGAKNAIENNRVNTPHVANITNNDGASITIVRSGGNGITI